MPVQNNPVLGLLVVLFASVVGGIAALRFKQPLFLGYLVFGLIFSQVGQRIGISINNYTLLAEIGVSLLMFTLGLEFVKSKHNTVRMKSWMLSACQVSLTVIIGGLLLMILFNFSFLKSFIISFAFSLSSTALVVRSLDEKGRLNSLPGELMTGWLLFQDLITVPVISLLAFFTQAPSGSAWWSSFGTLITLLFMMVGWATLGRRILPKILDHLTRVVNREVLLLSSILWLVLLAFTTAKLGFSAAIGAFFAGLMISGASSRLAIFSEIRPLRDVFLAIFFVSLGSSVQLETMLPLLGVALSFTILFLLLKLIISFSLVISSGYHLKTAIETSLNLAGVGEFSFLIASITYASGMIDRSDYQLISLVTLLTLIFNPLISGLNEHAYRLVVKLFGEFETVKRWMSADRFYQTKGYKDHVVLLGYGRVGQWVGEALLADKIPFVVVEHNPTIVKQLKMTQIPVIFGDPTDYDTLIFSGVRDARVVVSTIPDLTSQKSIVQNSRAINPSIKIVVRAHQPSIAIDLEQDGADKVVQPEFEAAMSMCGLVMHWYKRRSLKISREVDLLRQKVTSSTI